MLIVLGWNIAFTMTAYRSPEDKVVDTYVYGLTDVSALQTWVDGVHAEQMSDMEQMEALSLIADETYGSMILMTRMAAGEGDLYLLPKTEFTSYSGQGVFEPLEEIDGLLELFESHGIDLERGWYRNTETGERHLYGIPASCLPQLKSMLNASGEYYLSIRLNNNNEENTLKLFQIMVHELIEEPATQTDLQ